MGKSSSEAPDYTSLASASEKSALLSYELGMEQVELSRSQYEELKPLYEQITASLVDTQNQTNKQGTDYYNYWKNSYQPVEQRLLAQAESFNSDAYKEEQARQAAVDAAKAYAVTQQANNRSMAAMGVNPNSGRFAGQRNQSTLALAAQRANAMTNARSQAESTGYARLLDATSLGRGLTGASTGAYSVAINAGNSAGANASTAGNNYMAGLSSGASTIQAGQSLQMSGLSSILNSQTSVYNNSVSSNADMWGTIVGAGLGAATKSDRRLKTQIRLVGFLAHLGLGLYTFVYRFDPRRRWLGVMADEVAKRFPEAVVTLPSGYQAVYYDQLGLELTEVPA
ncbi:tail fiber domain-containing protein [Allochromatium humboldtianum]|uniref:Tail fiber domain-containing protein n=1 Tax=Allochromatium humboldtianum TaxID=504901 RepID=A0A850REE1_9GAMM|nr:tail fiber domain-containing protein [Allochromatium humboldtianum]NVZ08031.1 tail fiber domain-containing protein [Allochromatium humboldtianum]